jgi:CRP-like cAMP-binding protein
MTKGELSDSMYAIISGTLEVVGRMKSRTLTENRPRRVIATLYAGDVVGEMGMIRSCKRSATVKAVNSAELLQINERMIKRLQWLYPPTAHKFFFNLMTILCDRLQNLTECYLEETSPRRGV